LHCFQPPLDLVRKTQQFLVAKHQDRGGTASYTIGQIDYEAITDSSGTVTQGVQQPYEIYAVGIHELEFSISASLFPNPTVNSVILSLDEWETYSITTYRLTDEQGRVVREGDVSSQETFIEMGDLARACYYLNIKISDKTVKSFKIIKNN
jgi:hypothetical protein